jgi:CheY-like chemotaxis protein
MTFLKRILLIDPEPHATTRVRTALEATEQYLIKEEHDTRCALSAARWFQPNLILFELFNPGPQAHSIVARLQGDPACENTPVLFFSANNGDDRVVSGGILSGYSFFANAVAIEEFVRCVAELLSPGE